MRGTLQSNWPVLIKCFKVVKDQEIPKNYHRLAETKTTATKCNLGSQFGFWNRKKIFWKTSKIPVSSIRLWNTVVRMLITLLCKKKILLWLCQVLTFREAEWWVYVNSSYHFFCNFSTYLKLFQKILKLF